MWINLSVEPLLQHYNTFFMTFCWAGAVIFLLLLSNRKAKPYGSSITSRDARTQQKSSFSCHLGEAKTTFFLMLSGEIMICNRNILAKKY